MAGTPPLQLERVIGGQHVSLKDIYAEAGVELDIHPDQMDLPRKDAVALADLHAMMLAFRSLPAPADAMRVHLLVVSKDQDDPDTLGIMFDFGEEDSDGLPREGFAVFADSHQDLGTDPADEMLLTTAHELAHCFNLHHPDWEGQGFRAGSTIEGYSLADTVLWHLSQSSRKHLGGDPGQEVWPGIGSLAFGLVTSTHEGRHQTSPLESFDVVDPGDVASLRRGPHAHKASAARERRSLRAFSAPGGRPLELHFESPKRSFLVGEPVVLTVGLHNNGTQPAKVVPLLAPEYRFLTVEVKAPGGDRFEPFETGVLADGRGARARELAPGEALHEEVKLFFGADGWTFREPGTWAVRADFPAGGASAGFDEENGRIQSEPFEIQIVAPVTASEKRAKELIWGHQQGIYLVLGGGDHLKKASERLNALARETPDVAQAAAVRLALGKAALHPTVDPTTKVQSPPRLEEAKRWLQSTLEAPLPALSVAQAQASLVKELEKAGQTQDARQVRRDARRKLAGKESAKRALEKIDKEP